MQQNLAVEFVMGLTGISLHAPRKQRVWYKLYRPWDQRGNARFQNFLEVPTVCGQLMRTKRISAVMGLVEIILWNGGEYSLGSVTLPWDN